MVSRVENDVCVIDGGRIHGLHIGQEFDVYPPTARLLGTAVLRQGVSELNGPIPSAADVRVSREHRRLLLARESSPWQSCVV
ncbi:MAG: hypothetical protein U0936_25450 [Planctomycetaceae bacterium]